MFYAYVALLCSSNYIEVFFILLPQQFHIYCWTTSFEKNKMIQGVIQANYLNWHEIHLGDSEINNIWFYLCNYPVTVRSSLKILVRLLWDACLSLLIHLHLSVWSCCEQEIDSYEQFFFYVWCHFRTMVITALYHSLFWDVELFTLYTFKL